MTDPRTIAKAYVAAWNEADAARRAALVEAAFTHDIRYRDPVMQGDGHDGVTALIDGVHARFPGFRFAVKGEPDGFGEHVRFSWTLGPDGGDAPIEGTDIGLLKDGRLSEVTGFLDRVPAQ